MNCTFIAEMNSSEFMDAGYGSGHYIGAFIESRPILGRPSPTMVDFTCYSEEEMDRQILEGLNKLMETNQTFMNDLESLKSQMASQWALFEEFKRCREEYTESSKTRMALYEAGLQLLREELNDEAVKETMLESPKIAADANLFINDAIDHQTHLMFDKMPETKEADAELFMNDNIVHHGQLVFGEIANMKTKLKFGDEGEVCTTVKLENMRLDKGLKEIVIDSFENENWCLSCLFDENDIAKCLEAHLIVPCPLPDPPPWLLYRHFVPDFLSKFAYTNVNMLFTVSETKQFTVEAMTKWIWIFMKMKGNTGEDVVSLVEKVLVTTLANFSSPAGKGSNDAVLMSRKLATGLQKRLKGFNPLKHWMLDKLPGAFAMKPSFVTHQSRECLPLILTLRNSLFQEFVLKVAGRFSSINGSDAARTSAVDGQAKLRKVNNRALRRWRTTRKGMARAPLYMVQATAVNVSLNEGDGFYSNITCARIEEFNMDVYRVFIQKVSKCSKNAKRYKSCAYEVVLIGNSSRIPTVENNGGHNSRINVYDTLSSWIHHNYFLNVCYSFFVGLEHNEGTPLRNTPTAESGCNNRCESFLIMDMDIQYPFVKGNGYGSRVIVGNIKAGGEGKVGTSACMDLRQPKKVRQAKLRSRYQFSYGFKYYSVSPTTYKDYLKAFNVACWVSELRGARLFPKIKAIRRPMQVNYVEKTTNPFEIGHEFKVRTYIICKCLNSTWLSDCVQINGSIAAALFLMITYFLDYAQVQLAHDAGVVKSGGEGKFSGLMDTYRETIKSDCLIVPYHGNKKFGVGIMLHQGWFVCRKSIYWEIGLKVDRSSCALVMTAVVHVAAINVSVKEGIFLAEVRILGALALCQNIAFDKTYTSIAVEIMWEAIEPSYGHTINNKKLVGYCYIFCCVRKALAARMLVTKQGKCEDLISFICEAWKLELSIYQLKKFMLELVVMGAGSGGPPVQPLSDFVILLDLPNGVVNQALSKAKDRVLRTRLSKGRGNVMNGNMRG